MGNEQVRPAKKKEERIELRADTEWLEDAHAEASRNGLSLSSYIRLAVIEKVRRDRSARNGEGR